MGAGLGRAPDPRDGRVVDEVERGHEDDGGVTEVRIGAAHVDRDAAAPERAVECDRRIHRADEARGVAVEVGGPAGRPVEEEHHPRRVDPGPSDVGGTAEDRAELAHLAPHLGVGAGVGEQRGVELLGAGPAGPPLEEAHRVGSPGDVTEARPQQFAGLLGDVDRLPVHRARRVLHEEPGAAAGESSHDVSAERQLMGGVLEAMVEVVVLGDQVHLGRPGPVVHPRRVRHDHEVRRHRDVRGDPAEDVALGPVVPEELVGAEPGVVELLGRVGDGRPEPGREDLLEGGVVLAPEGRSPGVVEGGHVAVAVVQPAAEGLGGGVAVAVHVVAAQLVRDVPHREGRVRGIPAGDGLDEGECLVAEDGGAGAPGLAPAGPESTPLPVDGQRLGVGPGQPGWGGGGRRREIHADPALVEQVHDPVQPAELEAPLLRFEEGPREDADRREGDPGLPHQCDVLGPDVLRPLLGVVVATESDARQGPRTRLGDGDGRVLDGHPRQSGPVVQQSQHKPSSLRRHDVRFLFARPLSNRAVGPRRRRSPRRPGVVSGQLQHERRRFGHRSASSLDNGGVGRHDDATCEFALGSVCSRHSASAA